MEWSLVKKEMIEKGLSEEAADRIGEYMDYKGRLSLDKLMSTTLVESSLAVTGIEELKLLYEYLQVFEVDHFVEFDLSLARGLDYYTGVIYEAVMESATGVGSIAAGGRYDNLVGMFSSKPVPCVGVSIGVERVYSILSNNALNLDPDTKVMLVSPDGHLKERMRLAKTLWENDIPTQFAYKANPKIKAQLSFCDSIGIPIAVIMGAKEIENGGVVVKVLASKEEKFVTNDELVDHIRSLLSK